MTPKLHKSHLLSYFSPANISGAIVKTVPAYVLHFLDIDNIFLLTP